jgi:ribosomal protein S17
METRPIVKLKRWRLVEVVEKAKHNSQTLEIRS